jgi:trans-2,3-dihydro-3-hydroxyanthranilate isomerase
VPARVNPKDFTEGDFHVSRTLEFVTYDVFTERPLTGNQLAVFPDAEGLSTDEMQSIAREFNLSETTFVQRRDRAVEESRGIRVRIFTTGEELPFAGHPTLGTAAALRAQGAGDSIELEMNVGRVPVQFSHRSGQPFGEMTQVDPTFGRTHDPELVADALGVPVAELDSDFPIQTVSTGVPFAIVPFRRLSALQQWAPSWGRMHAFLRKTDAKYFYLISRGAVSPNTQIHARMVFYGGEDPATGGAAGPAIAWLVRNRLVISGSPIAIEQGIEIARPSRLFARADLVDRRVTNVRVGGFSVPVIKGSLAIP